MKCGEYIFAYASKIMLTNNARLILSSANLHIVDTCNCVSYMDAMHERYQNIYREVVVHLKGKYISNFKIYIMYTRMLA